MNLIAGESPQIRAQLELIARTARKELLSLETSCQSVYCCFIPLLLPIMISY
ncbi:BQ5605_C018g08730 [Microbotryum silenes-dioicae]|uniref:BQ5605_C018g08730 protein n=1 Tax=Microbotryum silenes-dioicae TaxID=796604 RepID=A0A2X0LWU4_9BASI|nr:BQ5605_C018g08730 [Microbotryum silenes-dioicae]